MRQAGCLAEDQHLRVRSGVGRGFDQVVRFGQHRAVLDEHGPNRDFGNGRALASLGQGALHVVSIVTRTGR